MRWRAARLPAQKALLESSERKLADTFKSLAADALEAANHSFLTLADVKLGSVVGPVNESLGKLDREIREIEGSAPPSLWRARRADKFSHHRAEGPARKRPPSALRAPSVRGRWEEIQSWAVEMADALERCDASSRTARRTTTANCVPDLRVQLPGGKNIIVDAKVPLQAYLEALEAPSEDARQSSNYAQQVRAHGRARL